MEHILRLADNAHIAHSRHHKGAAIFIDVEKAFDSVWHKGLNPLVALKREQANFLNFTIKMTRF